MKSTINVQRLYIDVPTKESRMLNLLQIKNFISAFQSETLQTEKEKYESPEAKKMRIKRNKIGFDTLSFSQQLLQERIKYMKELDVREIANFGKYRQKDAIGVKKYSNENTIISNNNYYSGSMQRENRHKRLPKYFVTELSTPSKCLSSAKFPLIKKNIGVKENVKLYDNNLIIHKSDVCNFFPDINGNELNKKYDLYELNDKINKNKKKAFKF